MKSIIKSYFTFSKKERNGLLFLCVCIVLLSLLPLFFALLIQHPTVNAADFQAQINALQLADKDSSFKKSKDTYLSYQSDGAQYQSKENEQWTGEMFYFNPNTLDAVGWKKLGIKDKTITTIQNYLSKGGKFYKPTDIAKIWGISNGQANRLIPYVVIEQTTYPKSEYANNSYTQPAKKTTPIAIDVNLADTTALIALPGIGSKLAQRIIAYRDKLGGFYSTNQVVEVYGLQDSVFQKIKTRLNVSTGSFTPLNINTVSLEKLKAHPYCKFAIANAIINYRNQHGNFTNVDELKKIMLVTNEVFVKLSPYLSLH
jgi:competence protein ComEA